VFWTRIDEEIPSRGVKLEGKERNGIDAAIYFVRRLKNYPYYATQQLNSAEAQSLEDHLIDLLVDRDEGLLIIFRNFKDEPVIFRKHAIRLLARKNILINTSAGVMASNNTTTTTTTTAATNQAKLSQEAATLKT